MNITQHMLIKQIADREDVNVSTIQKLFKTAENIIFEYLSSVSPSEEINVRLFKGINIQRIYMAEKKYSKGALQNINCPEHVNIRISSSKYYNRQINQKLFDR